MSPDRMLTITIQKMDTIIGSSSGIFGIYYVPKDKVKFFLDSVSSINNLSLDFIATVRS
ncbi:MAG: hypothetical protein ACOYK6_01255 [Chthoniobacterales bacterium]